MEIYYEQIILIYSLIFKLFFQACKWYEFHQHGLAENKSVNKFDKFILAVLVGKVMCSVPVFLSSFEKCL